jgi:Uma2 family endonuclease
MPTATDHITAKDYFRISRREGDPIQLIDGVLVVNEPRFLHGVVQRRLATALGAWCDGAPGRGQVSMPIDVVMSEHDVYGPDVVWFREERVPTDWEAEPEQQPIPDLAVEVRSPGTWRFDTGRKREIYEVGGLPELWLVDTSAETVTVLRRSTAGSPTFDAELVLRAGERVTSPLLPAFALEVGELFVRR